MVFLRRSVPIILVCAGALGLSACEQSTANACTSAQDVAGKLTALTDRLNKATWTGKIPAMRAGEIGARIVDAGVRFGSHGNHQAYCSALEKIRSDASLK
jgi:hypothetical protein